MSLDRQVDAREHRVNEDEKPQPEELDPNAQKKREDEGRPKQEEEPGAAGASSSELEEEDRGRHVDARA